MVYVLVPLMIVVAVSIVWNWRADRVGRDPVSSIDSFHRALEAMQPQTPGEEDGLTVDALHDGYAPDRSEQDGDVLQAWG